MTLDTSGHIDFGPHPEIALPDPFAFQRYVGWEDLDAFTQGYIEALFAGAVGTPEFWAKDAEAGYPDGIGFSTLAPEALARIIADCSAVAEIYQPATDSGVAFWRDRQAGAFAKLTPATRFPPLTPYLADDGKVHLKETPL